MRPLATERQEYRWLFVAVTLLLMAPLLFVDYVPMPNLPGHLARIHILQHYDEVPQFQAVYELNRRPVPDLAMDLIILPLTKFVSLLQAARIFVALCVAVFAIGCWKLSYSVHGRITPLAVLALFALYNSGFLYGLVAFHFSVGLSFVAVALWRRWSADWRLLRVAALAALSTAVYLSHLGGYVYLAIAIGWLTLSNWVRHRRISFASLAGLLPLVAPMLLYLFLGRNPGQAEGIVFDSISQKLVHLGYLFTGYDIRIDAAVAALVAIAALASCWYGKCRFDPAMGSLALVFGAAFLILPGVLLTGMGADARMIPGAAVFLLLSTTCDISKNRGRVIYAVALVALMARISFCGWIWVKHSDSIARHAEFLDSIPKGARVYPLIRPPQGETRDKFERVLEHVPDLAAVRRDAIVPTVFTERGQHSVLQRTPLWSQTNYDPAHPETFNWDRVAREYDVIWEYGRDSALHAVLDRRFRLIGERHGARLYLTRNQSRMSWAGARLGQFPLAARAAFGELGFLLTPIEPNRASTVW